MVIGFKKQFVMPILTRTKKHTIREDTRNRWKALMKMHMATGVRTKNYNQFNEVTCISTQTIEIQISEFGLNEIIVIIDGRILTEKEVNKLAINDGFTNIDEFKAWFSKGFKGKIIHWTLLQY